MPYILVEERRQHIIKAAIEVIAEEGLAQATTRRIAERAGAPLSALHYCFKDKNELIQVIAAEGAAMLQRFFAGIDPTAGFEAVTALTSRRYGAGTRRTPGCSSRCSSSG